MTQHTPLTRHAELRLVDRSIRPADLACFLDLADRYRHRPGGADALTLTSGALDAARALGVDPALLGRIRHLTLILRDGCVLTAYRRRRSARSGPRARRPAGRRRGGR